MVLICSSTSFRISLRVLSRMVAFPPFCLNLFWEGYHAAPWTQFLRHYQKLSGTFPTLKKITDEQIQKWSSELLDLLKATVERESKDIEKYVNHLYALNRGIDREALAKKSLADTRLKQGALALYAV